MTVDPEPVCVLAMVPGAVRDVLEAELSVDGYEVRCAESIAEVEARLTPSVADVLIVGSLEDRSAPCALLRGLRDGRLGAGRVAPGLPAVAIVPDGELTSLLRAFECGADDVVAQPVRYAELRARLAALLARASRAHRPQVQRVADLTIDVAGRSVSVADQAVELSSREWDLLLCLASEPSRVFTKQELLRQVWRTDFVGVTRMVDGQACRLRGKLAAAGSRCVVNVWGIGYRFVATSDLVQAA
ncbi:MAG: two-component system, OmpR family, phosphate regulon response regulator PhoB [Thermoleophilaceae bacterium]|jgi:DNA-binding response OmpR family regulator|nr:two-component system, OmpR family, phosphate regulon response regulator PhoB [Thermoleophilaceae bacterium]